MLVSNVSRKQMKKTEQCPKVISIVFVSYSFEGLGELTRNSKYIDRHCERLRADNGLGPLGISKWKMSWF